MKCSARIVIDERDDLSPQRGDVETREQRRMNGEAHHHVGSAAVERVAVDEVTLGELLTPEEWQVVTERLATHTKVEQG